MPYAKHHASPRDLGDDLCIKLYNVALLDGGHLGFQGQDDVRITILMVNLPQKVYSYIILGALVKKLLFQDWIRPSSEKCRHFCGGHTFFMNGV